jgi:hypothetical protein
MPSPGKFTQRESDLYAASVHLMDRKGLLLPAVADRLGVTVQELRSIRRRGRQSSRAASSTP